MGLEVGGIDHQPLRLTRPARKPGEDAVEHTEAAPSHEAVLQGLVGTVGRRSVAPAQPVADDVDDAADHLMIVDPWHPFESGKRGVIRRICTFVSQHRSAMAAPPTAMEAANQISR